MSTFPEALKAIRAADQGLWRAEACVTLFDDCREALLACEARGGAP